MEVGNFEIIPLQHLDITCQPELAIVVMHFVVHEFSQCLPILPVETGDIIPVDMRKPRSIHGCLRHCGVPASPNLWEILTRSATERAPIFLIACPRWIFTVISLRPKAPAICLFINPWVT